MSERLFFNNIRRAWAVLTYKATDDIRAEGRAEAGEMIARPYCALLDDVERLEREVAKLREELVKLERLRFGADAERRQLRIEVERFREAQRQQAMAGDPNA